MITTFKDGRAFVTYRGGEYEIKQFNGYKFAPHKLFVAITDQEAEFLDSEAEDIDNHIAYFFEDEEFAENSGENLFEIFNQHS